MTSIFGPITDIVEYVDRAGGQTECDEGKQCRAQRLPVGQLLRKDHRSQDENVLGPVSWAKKTDQRHHDAGIVGVRGDFAINLCIAAVYIVDSKA